MANNRARRVSFSKLIGIILIILLAATTFAAAEEMGSAPDSGEGGGKTVAFSVVETKPQNGAKNVAIDTGIWLLFNKNVVNMTVKDNNKANILLRNANGHLVSAEVTMRDDQIEPSFRREMIVVPNAPLEAATTYSLTIGKNVMAKNGSNLGKDYVVTFTTAGTQSAQNKRSASGDRIKPEINSTGSDTQVMDGDTPTSTSITSNDGINGIDSVSGVALEKNGSADSNEDIPALAESRLSKKEGVFGFGMIAGLTLAVIAVAVLLFRIRKRRKG